MKKTQLGATILEGSDVADLPLVSRNAEILEMEILKDRASLKDKVDKVSGKGLSTNDFTNTNKKALETDIPSEISNLKSNLEKKAEIIATNVDPKPSDKNYKIGQMWYNSSDGSLFIFKAKDKNGMAIWSIFNETGTIVDSDDTTGSPGSGKLIAGTMAQGFFGEVPSSEFITGDALCSKLGITEGTSQFSTGPWLKFALDGKILFRPKKAIRYSISWNHINSKNCVYGDKIIEINGIKYRVRLMKGALTDPSKYSDSDKGAKGSEWNKLMLPIHIQAKDKSWAYPDNVESNVPYWGIDYTDSDLQLGGSLNGRAVWCQEKTNESGDYRVYRGLVGVSFSLSYDPSSTYSDYGFAPVLEVVSDN